MAATLIRSGSEGEEEEEALNIQWAAPLALHGGLHASITSTFRRKWLEAHHPSAALPHRPSAQLNNAAAEGATSRSAAVAASDAAAAADEAKRPVLPSVGAVWASHSAAAIASSQARAVATAPLLWVDSGTDCGTSNRSSRVRNGQSVMDAALSYDSLVCQNDSSGLVDALGRLRRDG